jgi:hypothetical protein
MQMSRVEVQPERVVTMPIGRYFLSVGTALLAVLFLADACFPNSQPDALGRSGRNLDKSIIRITSTKKWPERIDFDTHLPTVVTTGSSNVSAASTVGLREDLKRRPAS